MTDHTALVSTLKAATEGSRELSDEVLLAHGWTTEEGWWWGPHGEELTPETAAERPDPTRSIDDGVALVPEGRGWSIVNLGARWPKPNSCYHASVDLPRAPAPAPMAVGGEAAIPALALSIAALRAQEQKP